MQENQDACDAGSTSKGTGATGGVDQGSKQMTLEFRSPGWNAPPMTAKEVHFKKETTEGVEWLRASFPELRLSPQAGMLVVQGMKLQNLFELASLYTPESVMSGVDGPFILLKASYKPYDSPPRLTDVVLARVSKKPEDFTEQQVLGALVQAVTA